MKGNALVLSILISTYLATAVGLFASTPSASEQNPGLITLRWDAVSWATSYNVYQSITPDFASARLITTNLTNTTVTDENATYGTNFYWIVGNAATGEANEIGSAAGTQQTILAKYAAPGAIFGAAAMGEDETIYLACAGGSYFDDYHKPGSVVALDSSGAIKWQFVGQQAFMSTPAVSPSGSIYAIGSDSVLYALDSAGQLKWKAPVVGRGGNLNWLLSPTVTSDLLILAPTTNGLTAFSEEGQVIWTAPLVASEPFSPVCGPDGSIYFTASGQVAAISRTGSRLWVFPLVGPSLRRLNTQPIVLDNGNIVVAGVNGLFELTPKGITNRFLTLGAIGPTPVARADGTLFYVGSSGTELVTVPLAGTTFVSRKIPLPSFESLTITGDGVLYVSTLVTDDKPGPLLCSRATNGTIHTNLFGRGYAWSPTITSEGTMLITSTAGILYKLRSPAPLPTNGWPTARFNWHQTGNRAAPTAANVRVQVVSADVGSSGQIILKLRVENATQPSLESSIDLARWDSVPELQISDTIITIQDASGSSARFFRIRSNQ